jgi:hypothetical protein
VQSRANCAWWQANFSEAVALFIHGNKAWSIAAVTVDRPLTTIENGVFKMAIDNLTNDDAHLDSVNRYRDCYVVRDEHYAAMKDFCRIMADNGILRIAFYTGQEQHAKAFSEIVMQRF